MAEAIGLVASVLQLAGTGLKLSQALYQYADSVATADRRIKDVAKEIKLTSFVIEELGGIFKQDDTLSLISKSAIATANETLDECSRMFGEIEATLNKSKKGKIGRLILPFREPKIELLRSHIDKLKSTLQLLMQVLMHAYQVSSKKLDREAEARQREEIRQLLENKKNTTKRYEESLQRFKTSNSNTELEDDEVSFDDSRSVSTLVAKSIGSTMTPDSLAECAQHVRILLESIERLQQALASTSEGDDHSDDHQMAIGSYFAARSHLDSVLLGSSNTGNKNVMLKTEKHINVEALIPRYKPKSSILGKEKKESIVVIETGAGDKVEAVKQEKNPVRLQGTKRQNEDIAYVKTPKRQGQSVPATLFGSSKPHAKEDDHLRYGTNPFSCLPDHRRQTQTFSFGSASGYSYHYSTSQKPSEKVEICVPVPRSPAYAPPLSSPAYAPALSSPAQVPVHLPLPPVSESAPAPAFEFEQRDYELEVDIKEMDRAGPEIASSPSETASRGNDEVDDLLKEWTTCFA
ncbi:hypothetical protein COCSADRAFT_108816 [Bipolaris sorokiniana ND90Pr]|uniref:Fungal N-terminal domain-containing protein n=1 Tax=Cochliobolus sativus (strain ND90Pr / ATCC 201652) TaxID=665912 RepID=M2TI36_COCSN|nr:uncharacterized protein COCSADRAFT_108816 [Bipolaris sorokiniana ND90Pr]EMD68372.1 hypothetical protein COCSADRAFT_108816 [Bipolaris sorokiniana ND90Pr]